jgi:tetratricopeptide (TPR) repeat protein
MLFDLRSPGRRRVIKVVYAILAALLAVGLIGFGIGSDAPGGLSEIFGGGGGADEGFDEEREDAEKKAEEAPNDPRAQLELVLVNIQAGNQLLEVDEETQQTIATDDAKERFNDAADAWDAYLKLKPPKLDTNAALQVGQIHFLLAQSSTSAADARTEVQNAAEAQQIAADANPSTGNFNNLALYLFFAGKTAEAKAAVQRAIALAEPQERQALQQQFDEIEKNAAAFDKQVKTEAKQGAAAEGENPLGEPGGALGGGSGIGGGALGAP